MILALGGNEHNMEGVLHIESILNSVKKHIGISEEETHFDPDIIIHINSVFSILNQMGIGPAKTFSINDEKAIWNDFLEDDPDFSEVKTYMYLKVKMIFDPPTNSNVMTAMKEQISELEWRLTVTASNKKMEEDKVEDEG